MLTLLLLVCLGQALAVGVHAALWWLRARVPELVWSAGVLVFAAVLLASGFIVMLVATNESQHPLQDGLRAGLWIAAFYGIVAALGLWQSVWPKERWRGSRWMGATCSLWAELGVAPWIYWFLYGCTEHTLRTNGFAGNPYFYATWVPNIFALTLLALALCRPLALRVAREIPALLQSARRFARF